jgi:hypothetical protein
MRPGGKAVARSIDTLADPSVHILSGEIFIQSACLSTMSGARQSLCSHLKKLPADDITSQIKTTVRHKDRHHDNC